MRVTFQKLGASRGNVRIPTADHKPPYQPEDPRDQDEATPQGINHHCEHILCASELAFSCRDDGHVL